METYRYCFDGIPENSIVAIGTCGGSPRKLIDRKRFESGLYEMVKRLSPHTIVVYGSANYECFKKLKEQGIKIIDFPYALLVMSVEELKWFQKFWVNFDCTF